MVDHSSHTWFSNRHTTDVIDHLKIVEEPNGIARAACAGLSRFRFVDKRILDEGNFCTNGSPAAILGGKLVLTVNGSGK